MGKLAFQDLQISSEPALAIFLITNVAIKVAIAGASPNPDTRTGANIPAALV